MIARSYLLKLENMSSERPVSSEPLVKWIPHPEYRDGIATSPPELPPTTIWKFTLAGPTSEIAMPAWAKIRSVGVQDDEIVLWAEVNPQSDDYYRIIHAINTGGSVRGIPTHKYISTVDVQGVVWHIYDGGWRR